MLTLLAEAFLSSTTLVERVWLLPLAQTERERIAKWVHLSAQEFGNGVPGPWCTLLEAARNTCRRKTKRRPPRGDRRSRF